MKLTKGKNSSLSYVNISFYLNGRIQKLHEKFLGKISEDSTKFNRVIDKKHTLL